MTFVRMFAGVIRRSAALEAAAVAVRGATSEFSILTQEYMFWVRIGMQVHLAYAVVMVRASSRFMGCVPQRNSDSIDM